MKTITLKISAFLIATLISIAPTFAQMWDLNDKIVASDRQTDDQYGASVSVSGTYLAVGAPNQNYDENGNNNMNDAGAVYMYEFNGTNWLETQKIVASDRAVDDRFSNFSNEGGVEIDGDYLIIGAAYEDEDEAGGNTRSAAGSVYIFERNGGGTWNEVIKLTAGGGGSPASGDANTPVSSLTTPGRGTGANFGVSVDLSGNYAVVGEYQASFVQNGWQGRTNVGAIHIFERISGTWTKVAHLVASDWSAASKFGQTVTISGNYIAVGTPNRNRTYVFQRISGVWTETQVLTPDASDTEFGFDVDMEGANLMVASESSDQNAYIYERSGSLWTRVAKVNDGITGTGMGVAISNKYAIHSASGASINTTTSVYERTAPGTWTFVQFSTAYDQVNDDMFAYDVGLDDSTYVAGAKWEDHNPIGGGFLDGAGSIYVNTPVTLPITLIDFSARWGKGYTTAVLDWSTASEINNDYFTIERSTDGRNFTPILTEAGAGNSNQILSYTTVDDNPYMEGTAYYRLKQTDFDGTYAYSKIIALAPKQEGNKLNLSIYPNPAINQLTISIPFDKATTTDVSLSIINQQGALVQEVQYAEYNTTNQTILLDNLATGVYMLRYIDGAGNQGTQTFLVHQK